LFGWSGVLRHHRSPARARKPAGQDPKKSLWCFTRQDSDALFPAEVQSFLNFLIAGWSPDESATDPRALCAILSQPEHTEPLGHRPCRRGVKSPPQRDFSEASFPLHPTSDNVFRGGTLFGRLSAPRTPYPRPRPLPYCRAVTRAVGGKNPGARRTDAVESVPLEAIELGLGPLRLPRVAMRS